ncbi:MAG TPA: FtsX-like permease family protein [Treponema sp.]|nr:FtsX-like permease family protein [Treponema sp.]HPC71164.1 FtsX-like permease family protein [Treponema sp.]HRS04984.1 FtsX-like permease family protein [Treponema sp.]HRU27900.1 FtsX-like permease family protein [Treponema sp.]
MPVIIRIAFRNIWEHRSKSIIIGSFIALGVIILLIGNSLLDSSKRGVQKAFIENFTGDVMIYGPSSTAVSIFGEGGDETGEIPIIPDFEKVQAHIASLKDVKTSASMSVAYGLMTLDAAEEIQDTVNSDEQQNGPPITIIFGVEGDKYFSMFPSIELVEGSYLKPGEPGIMVTQGQLERLQKRFKRELHVGDKVLITGFGTQNFKIRELPIIGIYKRSLSSSLPDFMSFADIDTARVLGGLTVGANEAAQISDTQKGLLSVDNTEDLFGDDMVDTIQTSTVNLDTIAQSLSNSAERERLNQADTGAWHFILIRLNHPNLAPLFIQDLNRWFQSEGIDAHATNWQGAAGTYGKFSDIVRIVFIIAILLVSVVAVIIMMNTLVISVIERTSEIGTMRALGAQRKTIRQLFLAETLSLTVVFGFIGAVLSMIIVLILNSLHISAGDNGLLVMLFGGDVLHLSPAPASFVSSVLLVFIVGYLAHLYPVSLALKIQPVKAIQVD